MVKVFRGWVVGGIEFCLCSGVVWLYCGCLISKVFSDNDEVFQTIVVVLATVLWLGWCIGGVGVVSGCIGVV